MYQLRMVRPFFFAAVALLALCGARSHAATIYRETFGRPADAVDGTGNKASTQWDWIRFNADGTVNTGNGVNGTDNGRPIDLANTASAGPHNDGTFNPYARGWHFLDGTQRITLTTEFSFDPGAYPAGGVTFSWYQGNANQSAAGGGQPISWQLAVRVGGAWYVSATQFFNTPVTSGANFGSLPEGAGGAEFKSLVYNPAAANWLTLNFDGDYNTATDAGTASTLGALAVGAAPGADLSGPITAFGLYRGLVTGNGRMDTFTIDAVPEPASAGMIGAALLGIAANSRRRTR